MRFMLFVFKKGEINIKVALSLYLFHYAFSFPAKLYDQIILLHGKRRRRSRKRNVYTKRGGLAVIERFPNIYKF